MTTPSIDTMLGLINNNNQTTAILENQRANADNTRSVIERNIE